MKKHVTTIKTGNLNKTYINSQNTRPRGSSCSLSTPFIRLGGALVAALLCLALAPNALYSATQTWTGNGTGNNWRQGNNWDSGLIPAVGDDLVFAGSTRPFPNNNNSAVQGVFNSITFSSNASSFTITGANALTVNSTIVNNSTNLQTMNNTITLGGAVTMNAASGNISLLQAVGENTAGRSLTKTGANTLTLSGNNTYTGSTTINAGTLVLESTGSIATSGTISVAGGATLNVSAVSGGWALGSSQTLKGSGTIMGSASINGNLQPGSSPGVLNFASNLTLSPTANTTMEINGSAVRGTDFDGIQVTSALTYDGTLTLAVGTTFEAGSYTFNLIDFGSQSDTFDAINLSGNYTGSLTGLGDVWSLASGVNTWTFTHSTGDLGLNVVPEPSTWALLAASLLIMLMALRRRLN